MRIRISQLRQRLDDWQMPLAEVAARALRVKPQDVLWARLLRKSVDARDKGDVHFTLTLDVETARPVRLPKNAAEVGEETTSSVAARHLPLKGKAFGDAEKTEYATSSRGDSSRLNQWREESSPDSAAADGVERPAWLPKNAAEVGEETTSSVAARHLPLKGKAFGDAEKTEYATSSQGDSSRLNQWCEESSPDGAAADGVERPALSAAADGIERSALSAEADGIERPALSAAVNANAASSQGRFPALESVARETDTRKAAANARGGSPLVVGMGPAGLFAALTLARAGLRPVVVERGRPVEARERDVAAFWNGGALNPESNVQFGEGGAGTFSDGKLNSGIKDPRCRAVLAELHRAGAPESILWQAKPHVGTDHLKAVVKNLRAQILALGGDVRFETRLTGLRLENGAVAGATLAGPDGAYALQTSHVILAVGHSARDTFEMLYATGANMSRKPFAIGARVEHRQKLIDRAQYGAAADHPALGAADYKLAVHLPGGRSVYTFCMCPGGVVVAAASEPGGVAVNGMSLYARDGENANSALLVNVLPEDFGGEDPLAGVAFQRKWERAAFRTGGGDYRAPAQKVGDFLARRPSDGPGAVKPTYRPGVKWGSLDACLPDFVTDSMRAALPLLDRKLKGFADPDAVLTGVETRSSSPVRIERDAGCQSNLRGLYPCGEGAGYAGGIMSAAVDGIRCAEAAMRELECVSKIPEAHFWRL